MPMSLERLQVQFGGRPIAEALEEARAVYDEYGCFVARELFDPAEFEPIYSDLRGLTSALFREIGRTPSPEPDGLSRFDDGVCELGAIDRSLVGRLFDAGRRLLPIHELSVDPRLVATAKRLMGSELVSASDIKSMRIDMPSEEKYLFDWHQDYPYVMDSPDAVVSWIPLQDVDEANGWLTVALGSHKAGIQKLKLLDPNNRANNKQRIMELANRRAWADFEQLAVPVKLGDALVFSTLLLHASGQNHSKRARFTLQIRFGNFLNPVSLKKGWPGSMRDGTLFHKVHPEFVED